MSPVLHGPHGAALLTARGAICYSWAGRFFAEWVLRRHGDPGWRHGTRCPSARPPRCRRRFVRKRVVDEGLPADIVQDAMTMAIAHAGDVRGDDRWWRGATASSAIRSPTCRRAAGASGSGPFSTMMPSGRPSEDDWLSVCAWPCAHDFATDTATSPRLPRLRSRFRPQRLLTRRSANSSGDGVQRHRC